MKTSLKRILAFFGLALLAICGVLTGLFFALRAASPFEYKEEILDYSERASLDPLLVLAVVQVESNFREKVESNRGARGLMQVMPNTGKWIANQMGLADFHEDMLFEPNTNIMLGTWYLAHLIKQFNDNVLVALAAYNAGSGNVSAWLKDGRWSGNHEDLEDIPFPETRNYIQKVFKARKRYSILYRKYSLPEPKE